MSPGKRYSTDSCASSASYASSRDREASISPQEGTHQTIVEHVLDSVPSLVDEVSLVPAVTAHCRHHCARDDDLSESDIHAIEMDAIMAACRRLRHQLRRAPPTLRAEFQPGASSLLAMACELRLQHGADDRLQLLECVSSTAVQLAIECEEHAGSDGWKAEDIWPD